MITNDIRKIRRLKDYNIRSEYNYPYYHDQKIDYDIFNFLLGKYEEKGQNFFFRVSQLPFPSISGQRVGAALRRISKNNNFVERWNNGKITVWHTKFNG